MTAACYTEGESMMTSLIIIKLKFVCFLKMMLVVRMLDQMLDHILDLMIIGFVTMAL